MTTCKGSFWRGFVHSYSTNDEIVLKKSLRLMNKMSCEGCKDCEEIPNIVADDLLELDIENRKIYQIKINVSHSWYSPEPEIVGFTITEVPCVNECVENYYT